MNQHRKEPKHAEGEEKYHILVEYRAILPSGGNFGAGFGVIYMPKNPPFSFTHLETEIDALVHPTKETLDLFPSIRKTIERLNQGRHTMLISVSVNWALGGQESYRILVENQQEAERVFGMIVCRGFKDHLVVVYEQA